MTRVLMLLSNPYRPDPRVQREMAALSAAGYKVSLLCWDRLKEFPSHEKESGAEIRRVQSVKSRYGAGWRQLFYLPRFWSAAVKEGLQQQADIVHCHDLDTLPAGSRLKARLGCRLVYDAHEDYSSLMSLYLPAPLVAMLSRLERRLLPRTDTVITASSVLGDKIETLTNSPVTVIGNYPSLAAFTGLDKNQTERIRRQVGVQGDEYLVSYIGGFSRNRLLLPLIEAAKDLPQWQVRLWGNGIQLPAVEQSLKGASNARYQGWAPPGQVPLYTCSSDVIYYCLKPDYPGAIYNAPNALANAMLAGRPVIANRVGDLGRIVQETGCGILLDGVTPQVIRSALQQLEDPDLRLRLGAAGRSAAEHRYNWECASLDLLTVYTKYLG